MNAETRAFHARLTAWLRDQDLSEWCTADRAYRSLGEYFDALRPLQERLYEAGWTRQGWPRAVGGLGGDAALRGVCYDALCAEGVEVPPAFGVLEIVGPTLIKYAPALAERDLARLIRGDDIACQGFSEPEAGSDLAALRTRAAENGDGFRINGQKTWVSHGHLATWGLLLARTGPQESRHAGLSALWVDMRSPGITVRPIQCANGRDELAEVFLDDVPVPRDALVGEAGEGWQVAMYLLQFERGNYGWQRQAWLRGRLSGALARHRTESWPGDHTAAVGDAFLALMSLRARSRRTLLRLRDGETVGAESSVDKLLMSTAEKKVFDAVRDLSWPELLTSDGETARAARADWFFSRITSIYGGAAEIQRDLVADHLLKLPRR